jgi:hypothetical protein
MRERSRLLLIYGRLVNRFISSISCHPGVIFFAVSTPARNAELRTVVTKVVSPPKFKFMVSPETAYVPLQLATQDEQALYTGLLCLPALSISIAVLRYRLWGIDWIIRRTLSYSALTLALLYVAGVVGLQRVFNGRLVQTNSWAVVGSTLAIATLFQTGIDRRFYRRKYDAEQILATFGAVVREETNLDQLNRRLLAVIAETFQPEQVSLWLRPPK